MSWHAIKWTGYPIHPYCHYFLYCYILSQYVVIIIIIVGSVCDVKVIVIGNGHIKLSSNPEWIFLYFTKC